MRLVKIDGINVIINMDRVERISWAEEPDSDGDFTFRINGNIVGYFNSRDERDRIVQGIYDKFSTPGERMYFDNNGYEIENRELWK